MPVLPAPLISTDDCQKLIHSMINEIPFRLIKHDGLNPKELTAKNLIGLYAGEPYIITDRGRPVVEIIPLRAEVAAILNMIEEGKATWEGGKPLGFDGPELLGEPLADAVIEDRR